MPCKNCGHRLSDYLGKKLHEGDVVLCQFIGCKCDKPEEINFGFKESSADYLPEGYVQNYEKIQKIIDDLTPGQDGIQLHDLSEESDPKKVGAQTMSIEPNAHLFNAKNKTITYPPELVELLKDGEYTTQVNPGDGKRLEVIVWKKVKTLYVDKIILDDIKQAEYAEIEDKGKIHILDREGKWVERND